MLFRVLCWGLERKKKKEKGGRGGMQSQHLQLLPYPPCLLFCRNAISYVKNGCVCGCMSSWKWAGRCLRALSLRPLEVGWGGSPTTELKACHESPCVHEHWFEFLRCCLCFCMCQLGLKECFNVADKVGTGCVLIETRRLCLDLFHSCTHVPAYCFIVSVHLWILPKCYPFKEKIMTQIVMDFTSYSLHNLFDMWSISFRYILLFKQWISDLEQSFSYLHVPASEYNLMPQVFCKL